VGIEGSGLICHRWSEKARKQMLDKQTRKAVGPRAERDPEQEFRDSLYWIDDRTCGFPASAFMGAMVYVAPSIPNVTTRDIKRAVRVLGSLLPVLHPKTGKPAQPERREDIGRIGRGRIAQTIFRGWFPEWAIDLDIRYNAAIMTAEQVVNLLNQAGFGSGIGEWRPSSPNSPGGSFGMFEVRGASS
jgi:hypothetical protein